MSSLLDSRLRGSDDLCYFGSFPRKRESRQSCGSSLLDSRLRGSDDLCYFGSFPRKRESRQSCVLPPLDSRLRGSDDLCYFRSFPRKRESRQPRMSSLLGSHLCGSDDPRCGGNANTSGHSRESGNPGNPACRRFWTPACAGVTISVISGHSRESGSGDLRCGGNAKDVCHR